MKKLLALILCFAFVFGVGFVGQVSAEEDVLAEIDTVLTTYFGRVQDNLLVQVGNMAHIWYGENELTPGTEYEDLPVISTNFVNHGGRDGPEDFSYIEDQITAKEDLYQYTDNLVTALKLDGSQIIEALEYFSESYNTIDPEDDSDQFLVDLEEVPDYDHHHMEGIEYQYDVTQPAGERVVYAEYEGEQLTEDMEFIVVTNSYRADSDTPNFEEDNIVIETEVPNVDVMLDYINNEIEGEIPELTHNWGFAPVETEGQVLFETSPKAVEYMEYAPEPVDHISQVGEYGGWAIMEFDLSADLLD